MPIYRVSVATIHRISVQGIQRGMALVVNIIFFPCYFLTLLFIAIFDLEHDVKAIHGL